MAKVIPDSLTFLNGRVEIPYEVGLLRLAIACNRLQSLATNPRNAYGIRPWLSGFSWPSYGSRCIGSAASGVAMAGKTPAVVLHQDRRRYPDALVVCRLSEFAELVRSRSDTPGR
jgi:hypothetical protein